MNDDWRVVLAEWRHKLVLTAEEKRVIVFLLAALFLGAASKAYRAKHPQLAQHIDPKHPWRKPVAAVASATPKPKRARKPRAQPASRPQIPRPAENENTDR